MTTIIKIATGQREAAMTVIVEGTKPIVITAPATPAMMRIKLGSIRRDCAEGVSRRVINIATPSAVINSGHALARLKAFG